VGEGEEERRKRRKKREEKGEKGKIPRSVALTFRLPG
jgi:hypothetical protein